VHIIPTPVQQGDALQPLDKNLQFAYECRIRDFYANNLSIFRPDELVSKREVCYQKSNVRADLRTINSRDVIFEWEFKIQADYSSIGQILAYVAQAKTEFRFQRIIRPIIAAFSFPEEIRLAIDVNNLGIERVLLPHYLRAGGKVPGSIVAPNILVPPRRTCTD
jgi:hypothetical protein